MKDEAAPPVGHQTDFPICLHEKDWGELAGEIKSIHEHISSGEGWRKAIIVACLGFVGQLILIATVWGSMSTRVEYHEKMIAEQKNTLEKFSVIALQISVNTERLNRLERAVLPGYGATK